MNYYNPYYFIPMTSMARPSLFGAIRNSLRGLNFSGILNGTQRTLSIVNQAIPLVKQVTPVMRNAKTMFKVMNEFKKTDKPKQNNNYKTNNVSENVDEQYDVGPTFFV